MSEQKKSITIKRVATPGGDVPLAEGVIEAFNIIINKITELNNKYKENLKLLRSKDLSEITADLEIAREDIIEIKSKLESNEKALENNQEKLTDANEMIQKMENLISQFSDAEGNLNVDAAGMSEVFLHEFKKFTESFQESKNEIKSKEEHRIAYSDLEAIMRKISPDLIRNSLDTIGNYQENKEVLLSKGRLIKLPKQVFDFDSKILLHGPSGNGKTITTMAVAKELELNVIELNLPLLLSNPLKIILDLLNSLLETIKDDEDYIPCILLIENLQIIQDNPNFLTLNVHLSNFLDEINLSRDKILVLCTTTDLELVDDSLLSRFDDYCEFHIPNELARSEILYKLLEKLKKDDDLDLDLMISTLSADEKTLGFTCREVARIVEKAYFTVLSKDRDYVTETDLYSAFQQVSEQKSKISKKQPDIKSISGTKSTNIAQNIGLNELESKINTLNSQIITTKKIIKNALRLALSDNYNLIERLVKLFSTGQNMLSIEEIAKVSGMNINSLKKILNKDPFNIIFPKISDKYTIAFSKEVYDEIITEFELNK
jgi:AAA+ superfamily predicted ATPase